METKNDRSTLIHQRLTDALNPTTLRIQDDSHGHRNHAGAKESGGGHFQVYIISEAFKNKSTIERHRMVYNALEGLIGGEIHAIQITAKTKAESD